MATPSALVVPVFIWHAPPSHNVTASYLSLEHGRFVTASEKGHVVLWKFNNKGDETKLEPQVMCFTQEAMAIIALEMGPFSERECLIGVSTNGSIFVWSLTDGQCQFSKSNIFKCSPTTLKLLPDRRHIAAAGHSPHVEILDLATMKIVRRMGPHQDWLVSLDWCMHSRTPMLVSISQDNLFRMWMLDDEMLKGNDTSNQLKEEHLAVTMIPLNITEGSTSSSTSTSSASGNADKGKSKGTENSAEKGNSAGNSAGSSERPSLGKLRSSVVSPSGSGLLVVHEHQVSVFSLPITNTTPGWSLASKVSLISAFWCDDLTVLLFNALGQGFLHRLPKSVLPLTQQGSGQTSYASLLFGIAPSSTPPPISASLANDSTTASLSPSSASLSASVLNKRVQTRESGALVDAFKISSAWKPSLTTENGTLLAELCVPEHIRRTFAVTEIHPGCVDNYVYLVHGNGQVILWELPTAWDRDMVQSKLNPTLEARLSEGWATKSGGGFVNSSLSNIAPNALLSQSYGSGNLKSSSLGQSSSIPSLNLSGMSSQNGDMDSVRFDAFSSRADTASPAPDALLSQSQLMQGGHSYNHGMSSSGGMYPRNFVTASLVLEKKLQLISGYADGTISMSKLPLDMNPRSWRAHNSRVNALLLMPADNKEYLISGSSDFYIRVWDLEAEPPVLVHTFANHCGPVRSLFAPDPQDIRRRGWKNRFFSIGEDRIVGLFGVDRTPHCVRVFPNHPAPISEVRWRPDEDYLLVQSTDGSVCVWEMESGTQESAVRGPDADTILSFAKPLSRADPTQALKPVSRQSITGVSIPIEGESPVQAVLLNIKYISQELGEHLQQFDQQRQAHQARLREASGKTSPRNNAGYPPVGTTSATANTSTTTPTKGESDALRLSRSTSNKLSPKSAETGNETSTSPRTPTATSIPPLNTGGIKDNPKLSLFMSAAQLGTYRSCAYLLPWGLDQDNDQLVIAQLYLKPPKPPVSYGMLGVEGNMSVLVPRASELAGRWQCSDSLTALHTLSSVAIAKCLLAYDVNESLQTHEQRTASSHLMSYFCILLPDKVSNFVYPSLTVLAAFWQDPLDDILQSARVILSSVLNRLTHEQRRMLAIAWGNLLTRNTNIASATNTPTKLKGSSASIASAVMDAPRFTSFFLRNQSVLVLSILGCEYPESLPTELAANVALELLEILFEASNSRMRVAAAELFGKGFQLWSKHLHEEASSLIHRLFKLAMVTEPKNLARTAGRALMLIGEKIPGRFTEAISQRFTDLVKSGGAIPTAISSPASHSGSSSSLSASSSYSTTAGSNSLSAAAASKDWLSPIPFWDPRSPIRASGDRGGQGGYGDGSDARGLAGSSGFPADGRDKGDHTLGHTPDKSDKAEKSAKEEKMSGSHAYVQSLREHAKVLIIVGKLVKAHRLDFYNELPALVDAVVKALNPHIPGLRDATLSTGTTLLNLMVALYPNLAIDIAEQRLAVGTRDGLVHVYDLSSATRVHTLTCHAPFSVSAVAFAPGKVLATYSMETGQVKIWKTTQSLFGILSGEPQTIKSFDVPCSVKLPHLSVSGAEPTVTVVSLKNLSDAAPPSSRTMKDLRQQKIDKIEKGPSASSSATSSAKGTSNYGFSAATVGSSINVSIILEGLSFAWLTPKQIKIERKWEDPALSSLTFPV